MIYFDPADQASFTCALQHAINDKEARSQAIEKESKVVAHYSWKKRGEEMLALYVECQ